MVTKPQTRTKKEKKKKRERKKEEKKRMANFHDSYTIFGTVQHFLPADAKLGTFARGGNGRCRVTRRQKLGSGMGLVTSVRQAVSTTIR